MKKKNRYTLPLSSYSISVSGHAHKEAERIDYAAFDISALEAAFNSGKWPSESEKKINLAPKPESRYALN